MQKKQYEVVDKTGVVMPTKFDHAAEAAMWATHRWPEQQLDPDRTGAGWDIQVVGSGD